MKNMFTRINHATGLGVIFACSSLIIGCAGNTVTPKQIEPHKSESTPVDTVKVETQPLTAEIRQIQAVAESESITYPDLTVSEPEKPEITKFNFGFDNYELNDEDKQTIRQHAKYLVNNPEVMVRVIGHTDHHGPKAYNEYLSKKRAEAVTTILLEEGVMESQIEMKAMASDKPIAEASHSRDNRRVELEFDELNMVSK